MAEILSEKPSSRRKWIGAAIGAAAAIGGGILGNAAARSEASRNRDWQAQMYGQRYQITMDDMRRAGLNPMLAYSQGVGSSPSGSMAAQGDFGGGTAGNLAAQADIRNSQANLNKQSAKREAANADLAEMKAEDYRAVGPNDNLSTVRRIGGNVDNAHKKSRTSQNKVKKVERFSTDWLNGADISPTMDPRLRKVILADRRRIHSQRQNSGNSEWEKWKRKNVK